MNNIQLKVKIVAVNAEYVGKDAKIVVSGVAKFQFDDQGKMKTRSIPYKAYGQTALALQNAVKDSVHAVSGQLNVFPPNDQNPNHSMLLTINKALPVVVTKAPVNPQPVHQHNVETTSEITY